MTGVSRAQPTGLAYPMQSHRSTLNTVWCGGARTRVRAEPPPSEDGEDGRRVGTFCGGHKGRIVFTYKTSAEGLAVSSNRTLLDDGA